MRRIIHIRRIARVAAICTAGLAAGTAAAQDDYTADDLLDLFEKQRAAYDDVRTRGLGQTRGLKLVTLEDVDPDASEAQAAEDGAAGGGGASVATGGDEPATYGQFAEELQINFQIEFGFDSAALADSEKPKLATMCEALKASPVELVRIVGHTDAAGTEAYNERLSVLRAEEVELSRRGMRDRGHAAGDDGPRRALPPQRGQSPRRREPSRGVPGAELSGRGRAAQNTSERIGLAAQ
jgi:outer membrane protein OmpA-like peptidoglycan-associated protein